MHHPPQIRGHCVLDCGKNCGGEMGCIIMMLCCGFRHSVEYSLCVSVNVTTSTTFASLEDKPRGKALRPKSWGSSPRDLKKPALFSEGLSVSNSPRWHAWPTPAFPSPFPNKFALQGTWWSRVISDASASQHNSLWLCVTSLQLCPYVACNCMNFFPGMVELPAFISSSSWTKYSMGFSFSV